MKSFPVKKVNKRDKLIIILTLVISLGSGLFIVLFGLVDNTITLKNKALDISGLYGETISFSDIRSVELVDQGPSLSKRTNGYSLGFRKKGHFKTTQGEKIKLFINSKEKPWVLIEKINGQKIYYSSGKDSNTDIHKEIIKTLPNNGYGSSPP